MKWYLLFKLVAVYDNRREEYHLQTVNSKNIFFFILTVDYGSRLE